MNALWNWLMAAVIKSWLPLRVKIWAFNHLKGNLLYVKDKEDLKDSIDFL